MTKQELIRQLAGLPTQKQVLSQEAKEEWYSNPENLRLLMRLSEANVQLIELAKQAETREEFLLCMEGIDANSLLVPQFVRPRVKALQGVAMGLGDLIELQPKAVELNVIRKKQ